MHTWSSTKLFIVELESALFVLGARGWAAGRHACWCCRRGSGLSGGHLQAAGGSAPSSAIPAAFRPSWWVQSWTPAPPSHTPFEHKLWDLGSRGVPGPPGWWRPHRPPCRWCGSQSATQSTVRGPCP